jgi:hypothetical protein
MAQDFLLKAEKNVAVRIWRLYFPFPAGPVIEPALRHQTPGHRYGDMAAFGLHTMKSPFAAVY